MTIDVIDLRDFYSQRLGIVARRLINRGIHARWPDAQGQRVLGLGYPTPYLGLFREDSERCIAFMPAAQGVLKWPTARPTLATLVDEFSLPLPDAAVDRVLLVHALEMSDDPAALLREVWRVLAPSGRMMAVIPNRRGVWTRTDTTPFGHGRPYSRSQITQLLRQTWFTPTGWGEALFMPPVAGGWFLRSAMAWERVGAALSLPFAGVHIVEATKQVYRAIPAHRERTRLIPALERVAAQHQSLLHFVGEGHWSDEAVLAKVREMVLPEIERQGPIEAWIIDDTGFPKKGRHSVGVARQYCGRLGKEDNCQVAVSLSLANDHASLPVAYRLYLPQEWTSDDERLRKAGVPDDITFKTKHEIALDQLRCACATGLPRGVVLMDAGYGNNSEPRPEEWLLIEWPNGESAPTKYWLSTLPESIALQRLVYFAKLRWRIERDYQELKQEVGLGHFEGRRWRGFHHHATLCIAAYGFLISERETIPPSASRSAALLATPSIPPGYRPRGSAIAA